jgi:A/G-specific adenine glycosylase
VDAKLSDHPPSLNHQRIPVALLRWYDAHARDLPWRSRPGAPSDPYRVWLSEIMLQQTTVATVTPRFTEFVARWPAVADLANAEDADLMAAWAGLGYYARARNLLACARAVMRDHGGAFPSEEAVLRKLPGIGDYTAAAIAAIAFGKRAVVVDGNVERVVARLFAIDTPLPAAKPLIRAAADAITPADRTGDFAQAMMDLGSSLCGPRATQCLLCPLREHCRAAAAGTPTAYPVKADKKAKPHRHGTVFWLELDGHVLLVRRPAKGLLGGMRALPDDGWSARADGHAAPPIPGEWREGGLVRHGFTHFDLELQLMLCEGGDFASLPLGEFWPVEAIEAAGLPTVFAKAARLALAHR